MPVNEIKSLFMPKDIDEEKIQPLSLGKSFGWYPKQGFYGSGKYFLMLQDEYEKNDGVIIHIIHFNKEVLKYERKTLKIKTQKPEEILERSSELDPTTGKLVHIVKRAPKSKSLKEFILDLYCVNLIDFVKMNDFNEITIQKKKADLKIIFDAEQYNDFGFNIYDHHCEKETTVLTCQALCSEECDNSNHIIVSNQVCLDFVHITENKTLLNKRIIINLKATPGFLDYVSTPQVHCNGDRILFFQETEDEDKEILSIQEFDCYGKFKHAYATVELLNG